MARQRSRRHAPASGGVLLAIALGALFAAFGVLVSTPHASAAAALTSHPAAPARQLGSTDPTITWDGSMIFPSQNSGNPWGPVGEHAQVQGSNFPDGAYDLVLALGDVNNDATVCSSSTIPVGPTVSASGGAFTANFDWPAAANQVNSTYSICALNDSDHSVASHQDTGPFTVLSANAPSISISSATVAAGGKITVTGQNFVPEQTVTVYVAPCSSCGAPKTVNVNVNSSGHTSGTFSTTLTLPASTAPNSYFVGAISANGVLSADEQSLAVGAAPTATPTATGTATAGLTATTTANGSGGGSGGDNSGTLIILGIVAVVILAVLAGLIAFFVTRRSSPSTAPTSGAAYGAYPIGRPYSGGPPPLPMPDWNDPAAQQVEEPPVNYDDPTDPGLGTPGTPRKF